MTCGSGSVVFEGSPPPGSINCLNVSRSNGGSILSPPRSITMGARVLRWSALAVRCVAGGGCCIRSVRGVVALGCARLWLPARHGRR